MLPPPLGVGCTAAEAVRLLQSERDNLDLVAEIVARERLDVDFWRGELLESTYQAFALKSHVLSGLTSSTPHPRRDRLGQEDVRRVARRARSSRVG
jgi:hypothetical protein